jgi:hypothetical protein
MKGADGEHATGAGQESVAGWLAAHCHYRHIAAVAQTLASKTKQ